MELARKIKSGHFEIEDWQRTEVRFEVFAKTHLEYLKAEHAEKITRAAKTNLYLSPTLKKPLTPP